MGGAATIAARLLPTPNPIHSGRVGTRRQTWPSSRFDEMQFIPAAVLATPPPGLPPSTAGRAMAAKSLIFALMAFVQANFPLDAPDLAPFVKFVSAETLHYMAQPDVPYSGEPTFGGLHRNGFIFLAEPWSAKDLGDRARLLHELVHYMQARSDRTYPCRGAREAEAYSVQRAYLESEGADPANHMPNGVRIGLATLCHPAGDAARSR